MNTCFAAGCMRPWLPVLLLIAVAGCGAPPDDPQSAEPSEPLSVSTQPGPVVRFSEISGKTPAEVAGLLGEPSSEDSEARQKGGKLTSFMYRGDSIGVRYPQGKAEWMDLLIVPAHFRFAPSALQAVGLPDTIPPSFANDHVVRWENFAIPGFREVFIFPAEGGKVHYIYAIVNEQP